MKIGDHNEFAVPFSPGQAEAFTAQVGEVLQHAGCLLVEWSNGDNLIMSDCREGFVFFTFFSGTIHRWKVRVEYAKILVTSLKSDHSSHCGIIKAQCAVLGSSVDEAACADDLRDAWKKAA